MSFRSSEFQGDKRSGTWVAKPGAAIDEKQTRGIKRCGQIRLLPVVAQVRPQRYEEAPGKAWDASKGWR